MSKNKHKAPDAPEVKAPIKHVVSEGQSVTSLIGILGPGDSAPRKAFHADVDYEDLKKRGWLIPESEFKAKDPKAIEVDLRPPVKDK